MPKALRLHFIAMDQTTRYLAVGPEVEIGRNGCVCPASVPIGHLS